MTQSGWYADKSIARCAVCGYGFHMLEMQRIDLETCGLLIHRECFTQPITAGMNVTVVEPVS